MTEISDEIWLAFSRAYGAALADNFKQEHPYPHEGVMHAALAAVAPALRAEGMREAAQVINEIKILNVQGNNVLANMESALIFGRDFILARAAELEKGS